MNLNEYIIENADRGGDESFLRRFSNVEVFFSLADSVAQLPDGLMQVAADAEIKLKVAILDIGRFGVFYASKDDDSLAGRFAGMPLIRAAQMVCDLPEVDGMLIQSDADAWFVAKKEALRKVIGEA